MNFKRIASLAAPLLIAAASAAPAQAVVGGPVSSVNAKTMPEGGVSIGVARGNCPTFSSCLYELSVSSGTAIEGTDFTAPDRERRITRRNRHRFFKTPVTVIADGVCEPAETLTITLTGTGAEDDDSFVAEATQTIPDADCAAQPPGPQPPVPQPPAPQPPAPTFPADSGTPTETTMPLSNGTQKECRTPFWIGQKGAYGAQGFYNSGCTVTVSCPTYASVCQARGEGANNSEANRGERVSLNSRLRAFSRSNTQYWFRDQSCAGTDWCRTEDAITIRGGESISNQCNGVRAEGPTPNRTAVRCSIRIEVLY